MEVLTSGSVITDSIDKTEAIDSFDLKLSAHDVEDDDVCVVLKRGRVSRLHLEDSDDETETANEELDTKDTDHADDEESSNKKSETEGHLNTSSKRRSRIIRVESSSDEENDEGPNERLRNDGFEGGKKTFEKNYQPSDINVNVNTDMNNVKQRLPFSNDDLFDAEESDKENEEERSALPSYDETIDGEICLDNIKKSAKLLVVSIKCISRISFHHTNCRSLLWPNR